MVRMMGFDLNLFILRDGSRAFTFRWFAIQIHRVRGQVAIGSWTFGRCCWRPLAAAQYRHERAVTSSS